MFPDCGVPNAPALYLVQPNRLLLQTNAGYSVAFAARTRLFERSQQNRVR